MMYNESMLDVRNLNKEKKYLIGCSGGADSMALLDMMVKQDYDVTVCHVNYHMRDTCYRDQRIVEKYCANHQLPFRVYNSYYDHSVNFENFAREERYRFFSMISQEISAEAVVVGHQRDDVIETYLMQKERNIVPETFGLTAVGLNFGLKVIRPLLNYTKKQLEDYCEQNRIETGFDESNDQNQFRRNRLRKELSKWTDLQKNQCLSEMEEDNKKLRNLQKEINTYLKQIQFPLKMREFQSIPQSHQNLVLRYLLSRSGVETKKFSKRFIDNILEGFNERNKVYALDGNYELIVSYGDIYLERVIEYEFSYKFDRIEAFKCKDFELALSGKQIEAMSLNEEDFPITIRNGKADDLIEMRFGKKKLGRFWIDRKISLPKRRKWLVVENKMGRIIFIEGLGCDIHHFSNKPNLFVIKYCSLEDEYYASAC